MALSLPKTLVAGTPENVNDLNTDLNYLLTTPFNAAGSTNIATAETRTNVAFGTLATPDQVTGVVLPTNGLLAVAYWATWQCTVSAAGQAGIFLGSNRLKVAPLGGGAPVAQMAVTTSGIVNFDMPLSTYPEGLRTPSGYNNSYPGDVTTGQALAMDDGIGGVCYIFAAAGSYTVSVQYAATSGSVTAKNRRLYVWALTF